MVHLRNGYCVMAEWSKVIDHGVYKFNLYSRKMLERFDVLEAGETRLFRLMLNRALLVWSVIA